MVYLTTGNFLTCIETGVFFDNFYLLCSADDLSTFAPGFTDFWGDFSFFGKSFVADSFDFDCLTAYTFFSCFGVTTFFESFGLLFLC